MTVWVWSKRVNIWGASESGVLAQADVWRERGWELGGPPAQDYAPHCALWHARLTHA